MAIRIRRNKKKLIKVTAKDEELLYTQVSRYWKDKTKAISYLRKRCDADHPIAVELKQLLEIRGKL